MVVAPEARPETISSHVRTREAGRLPDSPPADFQTTAKTWGKTRLRDNICKDGFGG
jgi:hypothetical protein